jgi:hypothetical protein
MANTTVLNVDNDIMITRFPSFKRVRSERCFGMLRCISTNLSQHFSFSATPLLSKNAFIPVKNVIRLLDMSSKKWYNSGQCNGIDKGKKALPGFSKLRENEIQKIKTTTTRRRTSFHYKARHLL